MFFNYFSRIKNTDKNKIQLPFWIATTGILIVLTLPRLLQNGMFTDGVLYAAIAHNLANGLGDFWHPYFNETMFPFFHQQPPLTFGIQAVFFKIFGDSIYVERIYSFLTLLISAWLIHLIWKNIFSDDEKVKKISWLPIILWIIIPVCIWSYSNNMEENTMGIFALLSVLFAYKGLNTPSSKKIFFFILAGITASLAFLCKGFPGLFAMAVPFLYWLFFRTASLKKTILYSAIISGTIALIFGCLFLSTTIRNSLLAYLNDRVANSILHVSTQGNRFYLLEKLFFVELMSPFIFCLLFAGFLKWKTKFKNQISSKNKHHFLFFFFIGLAASIPLIITKEQREFYLVTSLPYFAIAFAITINGGVSELVTKIKIESTGFKIFKTTAILFLAGSILFSVSSIGKTARDKAELADIGMFGKIIPAKTTIRVFPKTWNNWGLHNYMMRYFTISMSDDSNATCDYFLVQKKLHKIPSAKYSKINLNTSEYDLYKRLINE